MYLINYKILKFLAFKAENFDLKMNQQNEYEKKFLFNKSATAELKMLILS